MRGAFQKLFTVTVLLFVLFTSHVRADETVYWDSDEGFDPSTVIISPGEDVTWYNVDPYGFPVRISVSGFQPVTLPPFQGVYATFNTEGQFSVSSDWGDFGTVIVTIPPSIAITNLLDQATFPAPATLQIQTSNSLDVVYVSFWLDSGNGPEFLDYDYEPPFSYGLTNLAPGSYTIQAVANDGYLDVSDSKTFTVNEVAPVILLSNPRFSGAAFLFDANGLTVGKTQLLQSSTNCTTWTSIVTNVAAASVRTFTNAPATGGRFYRVVELAAPGL